MEKRREETYPDLQTIQTHTIPAFSFWSQSQCLNFRKNWKFERTWYDLLSLVSLGVCVFKNNRISLQKQKGSLKRTWKTQKRDLPRVLPSLRLIFFFFFFSLFCFCSLCSCSYLCNSVLCCLSFYNITYNLFF